MCGWFDAYSAGSCTLTVTAGGVTGSCTLTVNSAEAQPTAATYNLVNLGTSVSTSYTSSDGFMTIACSSNKGNHGLVMTNGNTVKIKVLAGAVIKFF